MEEKIMIEAHDIPIEDLIEIKKSADSLDAFWTWESDTTSAVASGVFASGSHTIDGISISYTTPLYHTDIATLDSAINRLKAKPPIRTDRPPAELDPDPLFHDRIRQIIRRRVMSLSRDIWDRLEKEMLEIRDHEAAIENRKAEKEAQIMNLWSNNPAYWGIYKNK